MLTVDVRVHPAAQSPSQPVTLELHKKIIMCVPLVVALRNIE